MSLSSIQAQNFIGKQDIKWIPGPNTQIIPPQVGNSCNGIIKHTGTNNNWDADAISQQVLIGDGSIEFEFPVNTDTHLAVGLNLFDAGRTNTDLDYSFLITTNGPNSVSISVLEKGQTKASLGTYYYSVKFKISRTDSIIKYFIDGNPVFTSTSPSHGSLFVDCSFYKRNSQVNYCYIYNGDQDDDKLPDQWERKFLGANPSWLDLVNFDPFTDNDADNVLNWLEFKDRTDPQDPLNLMTPVTWTAMSGVDLYGYDDSGLIKHSTASSLWDADAISTKVIAQDGELNFSAPRGINAAIGLSSTTNAVRTQADLTYGIILASAGSATAKRPESTTHFTLGEYVEETVFTIRRKKRQVSFLKDGLLLHTSTTLSDGPLRVDCSLSTPGSGFSTCRLNNDDLDGDTLPDSWERRFLPPGSNLAALVAFTPEGDPDGDLQPNLHEYLEGTHPLVKTNWATQVSWVPSSAAVSAFGTEGGVKRVSGTNSSWTVADAVATKSVPISGRLTFRVKPGSNLAIGLNLVNNNRSNTDLDFNIRITAAGASSVNKGDVLQTSLGTNTADTTYAIQRIGGLIEFYKDGQLCYSLPCNPTAPYLVDTAFYTVNSEVTSAQLHVGDLDEDGIADEAEIAAINAIIAALYGPQTNTLVNAQQLHEFLPGDDSDEDGVSNLDEFRMGTDMARADSAPEAVVWQNKVNTTEVYTALFSGGSINIGGLKKTSGTNSVYNADAVATKRLISDGGVCFKVGPPGTLAMGLTYENNNRTLNDLEYAFVITSTGIAVKRPESTTNLTIAGTYTVDTHFQIRRTGSVIEYLVDGAVAYTSTTPALGPLIIDCSIFTLNHDFHSVWFISGDQDEDGIPDAYELAHDLNPASDDALADADGDQIPNLWEYERGTSASDRASQPQADAVVAPWLQTDLPEVRRYKTILAAYDSLPTSTAYRSIIRVLPGVIPLDSTLGSEAPPQHLPRKVAIVAQPPSPAGVRMPVLLLSAFLNFRDEAVLDGFVVTGGGGNDQPSVMCMPASGLVTPPRVRLVNCLFRDCSRQITVAALFGGAVTNLGARLEVEHCTLYHSNSYMSLPVTNEYQEIASLSNISGTLTLRNSIVWDDPEPTYRLPCVSPVHVSSGAAVVENCIIRGGAFNSMATDPELDEDSSSDDHTSRRGCLTSLSIAAMATAMNSKSVRDFWGELRPSSSADLGPEQWLNSFRDTDNDGLADRNELLWFGHLNQTNLTDTDGDGIPDYLEISTYGTNPLLADSNGDGIPDGFLGSFNAADQDGDGLTNAQEAALGTDPRNPDTDEDGHFDSADAFPLNATMWQVTAANPADTTPPVITLDEPLDASLLP